MRRKNFSAVAQIFWSGRFPSLGGNREGQHQREGRALSDRAGDSHFAFVRLDDFPTERQTQARAALAIVVRFFGREEICCQNEEKM